MVALLRQRNFGLLWFAGLISLIGDWMLLIGLPIYVYTLTRSTLATSTMFIVEMIPRIALGSVAGVFVDRWNRKRIMVVTNILLALGLLPLLLFRSVDLLWVVYVVAFFEAVISQFFAPAESALLPRLVDDEHLGTANSLSSLNQNMARLIGPPLGGIVAGLLGLTGVALLDAASFLIAGGMIALIAIEARPIKSSASFEVVEAVGTIEITVNPWLKVWYEWLAGLRLIRQENPVFVVFMLLAITSLGEGVFSVLFVVFVNRILHGGALQIGWLMGAQAVGGLIGGLLVGYVASRVSSSRLIGFGAIAFGFVDLVIFNYPAFFTGFIIAVILFVIVGIPGVGMSTGITTLLQTAVADEYRGRIFGAIGTTSSLLMLLGTTLAGLTGDLLGVVTVLNIQGAVYVLAGVVVLLLLRTSAVKITEPASREPVTT
ncbi:MAG TPA: MFS transporter [Ktedonobacteraceae bacterium]|nr:MFS transporter [Ktedonobacteraceae bacterium]